MSLQSTIDSIMPLNQYHMTAFALTNNGNAKFQISLLLRESFPSGATGDPTKGAQWMFAFASLLVERVKGGNMLDIVDATVSRDASRFARFMEQAASKSGQLIALPYDYPTTFDGFLDLLEDYKWVMQKAEPEDILPTFHRGFRALHVFLNPLHQNITSINAAAHASGKALNLIR